MGSYDIREIILGITTSLQPSLDLFRASTTISELDALLSEPQFAQLERVVSAARGEARIENGRLVVMYEISHELQEEELAALSRELAGISDLALHSLERAPFNADLDVTTRGTDVCVTEGMSCIGRRIKFFGH